MRTRFTPPVFDRQGSYESSSRAIRWVCLGLALATYPSNKPYSLAVFTLIIVVVVYNGLRYSRRLMRLPSFASRANTLAVDHIFVLSLVYLSGGLSSPYYPFFFLLIIGTIASYGVAGFALSLAGQVIITPLLLIFPSAVQPTAIEFQFIIKLVFLIIFSLVAQQSVRSRDEEDLLESRFTHRIENERQRLLSLINSLSSAVLAIDDAGNVYLYNAAALELLNTNRDISGLPISELLPLHDAKYTSVDIYDLIRDQDRVLSRQDLVFVPNDGSEMVLDLTVSPVHVMSRGRSRWGGYMAVFRDITKQKSLEEERDEFISVTSHELRTPLAIAEANLSTALLPGYAKIEPKAKELLAQAHQNVIFLSQLIKDLTTLSRAERGSLKTEKTIVNLGELLRGLARDFQPQVKAKGLKLEVELDKRIRNLVTSESELREIVQNLLTNALKYTAKGTITLQLSRRHQATVISVHDTGIGISASDKAQIFTKFYRSEDYRTRATGGTGLGLYISRKLAEHLGFEMEFSSRLNRGSVFRLIMPDPSAGSRAEVAEAAQLVH
ncbi:MAG TPA: ATP-binding protein [Candidatus Saccharimonadia bacterium]|nr:ATP-binding protein [Candidatus Saccharimonadia bacterium]